MTDNSVRDRTDNLGATVFLDPRECFGKGHGTHIVLAFPCCAHLLPPR
jgi:hypothetical protein